MPETFTIAGIVAVLSVIKMTQYFGQMALAWTNAAALETGTLLEQRRLVSQGCCPSVL